ncbi:MAG: TrmH family RNA methyltransferase [Thermoguttaceae bacterium]
MITSLQNPRVKEAVRLRSARDRQREGRIIIEGVRELARAIQAGVRIREVFICEALLASSEARRLQQKLESVHGRQGGEILQVSERVFEKLAFGKRGEGVLGIAEMPRCTLSDLSDRLNSFHPSADSARDQGIRDWGLGISKQHSENLRTKCAKTFIQDPNSLPKGEKGEGTNAEGNPLIAVLEGVEKPGNIGAVLRSADAAGVWALIVADGRTDLYNPNAIRASLGTIFSMPVCEASSAVTLDWLRKNNFSIVAARVDGSLPYSEIDYRSATAIVLGSEAEGLTSAWNAADIKGARLPMLGTADSLNVSAAAAVFFFEALRQRRN